MNTIGFEEEALLMNDHIFLVKQRLSQQLVDLLGICANSLRDELNKNPERVPAAALESTPKISRGENYLGRPWTILDYPRVFSKSDMFAFRTMCWWGQGFSMTLLLKGNFLQQAISGLCERGAGLAAAGFYVGVSDDPFVHHFGEDNLRLLKQCPEPTEFLSEQSRRTGFIKLVKLLPLTQIRSLPEETLRNWVQLRDAI